MSADVRRGPRPGRRALVGAALGGIALALSLLARVDPERTDALYSRGLFPRLRAAQHALAGWLPISAAELGIILALVVAIGLAARGLARARRPGGAWALAAALGAGNTILVAGALVLAFVLLWGLNHGRQPLAEHIGIVAAAPSDLALARVSRSLARRAAADRAALGVAGTSRCAL